MQSITKQELAVLVICLPQGIVKQMKPTLSVQGGAPNIAKLDYN